MYLTGENFRVVPGVRKLVRLGDKLVDWNDNFRLFLFSQSTGVAPMASPQANALVNTINFNTTEAGLSEQVFIFPSTGSCSGMNSLKIILL